MHIVKFITYNEAENKEENGLGGMGGFFSHGMRWKDYIGQYNEIGKPMVEKLRKAILENHIKCDGSSHQNGYPSVPLWSNGKVDTYSFRAWGDLMAAVWSEEEGKDYSYMDFYC